jgi:predicted nucleotidyltransferase
MGLPEDVKAKRQEILIIAARHGARNVRLFGSVARGEADERRWFEVTGATESRN